MWINVITNTYGYFLKKISMFRIENIDICVIAKLQAIYFVLRKLYSTEIKYKQHKKVSLTFWHVANTYTININIMDLTQ